MSKEQNTPKTAKAETVATTAAQSQKPAAAQKMEDMAKALELKLKESAKLATLQRGYNKLNAEILALEEWEIKMDEGGFSNHATISLMDSNRKEFSTKNPVLVSMMVEHLKELFLKRKLELEKLILAFQIS